MASAISLGIHEPSAVPFLVEEQILPADQSKETYTWETGVDLCSEDDAYEEELLTTDHCVVWSRGGTIQRTFRLDVEGETVTKALFARFPSRVGDASSTIRQHGSDRVGNDKGRRDRHELPSRVKLVSKSVISKNDTVQTKADLSSVKDLSSRRALVIVLKTQAHIYFMSEASCVVHLPFEVDTVYPLPRGILLQRTVKDKQLLVATPQIPSAPDNTFALPQPSLSQSSARDNLFSPPSGDPSSPFSHLLHDLLQASKRYSETPRPNVACLIDPLSEISHVVTRDVSKQHHLYANRRSKAPSYSSLGPDERIIHVAVPESIGPPTSGSEDCPILAVVLNQVSGSLSTWNVSYLNRRKAKRMGRHTSAFSSGTMSRRQSLYGHDTGASTPRARGSTLIRETATTSMSQDLAFGGINGERSVEILDSAFEEPMELAKTSRRVSSLLARADLAGSNDRVLVSADPKSNQGKRNSRRGTSFGPHAARVSTNAEGTATFRGSKPLGDIRSSIDSVTLSESQSKQDFGRTADSNHNAATSQDPSVMYPFNDNLQKEILLHKISSTHSVGLSQSESQPSRTMPKVVTMQSANESLGISNTTASMTVFVVNKSTRDLLILRILATRQRHAHKGLSATTGQFPSPWTDFTVTETSKSGILDICKFGDGRSLRIATLSEDATGRQDLLLQSPWGSVRKIELPSPLNVHHPYQVNIGDSPQRRREGGFKRILSGGPRNLLALENGTRQGSFDVVDSGWSRHRIALHFRPHSMFVSQIIRVCEAILPTSPVQQGIISYAWWETVSWLRTRQEEFSDIEWTAMIVVLFLMATPFIEDRRTDVVRQQRRRKVGLLRSSSGAHTDLGSWETMITQEHDSTSTTPVWMTRKCWQWTKCEDSRPSAFNAKPPRSSAPQSPSASIPLAKKSTHILHCISLSQELANSPAGQAMTGQQGCLPTAPSWDPEVRRTTLASILIALHLLREEYRLNTLAAMQIHQLTPILAQIGGWLRWQNWGRGSGSAYLLESADMESWLFDDSVITSLKVPPEPFQPPSVFRFVESISQDGDTTPFVSLVEVASPSEEDLKDQTFVELSRKRLQSLTPRTMLVTSLLTQQPKENIEARTVGLASWGLKVSTLETLPEGVAISFRTNLSTCMSRPSTGWNSKLLKIIGRDDLAMLECDEPILTTHAWPTSVPSNDVLRDVHSICHTAYEVEVLGPYDGSAEIDRQSVTRLLFKEDQRFAEAARLVHPLLYPIARCAGEPEWSDTDLLEAQQELVKVIAMRTLSVSLGRGLIFYNARTPILTEKFPIHGFTLSCTMKPGDTTVTADRTSYTEEKVSWAFFHAGAEAGLSISKEAKGVNTSWILFNKPRELNNRHAGFLLAMGLNGHLKSIAKWVAFRYLTPKHSMTSVGLLLGLAASHLGTMDTLVTRLLSVHVTRMLPPGAAELNLSPLTQTSGIMGIGLLYCNTQHRRMSEIMLSEMENVEDEDNSNPLNGLRDEGYRLAAGFALGFINLGRGSDLKGLHDMHIAERLLALAVAAKRGDQVHILDRATAGATVAIALIFMKSHNGALARKIDIPDTPHQFEYVRPDHFLLRTVAKHLIMWDDIRATPAWVKHQLPSGLRTHSELASVRLLTSENLPLLNIIAGLCLAIGLRYAGSGSLAVRDLLHHYLIHLMRICRLPTLNYDGKLARITVRNCQDLVALSAACVMAGTGDIRLFRCLRSLHGRSDAETPYGSHLATHFAIGVLFVGGGSHTFGTSNLAIASLLCAFYPLFPNTVLDNKSHLQAFRHLWVLAVERRCLVARDVDTQRPINLPILVILKNSGIELAMTAPCLLPELDTISQIQSNDPEYWRVTLDLLDNPKHLEAFKRHQSIYLRRRAPYDAHTSFFSATMQALNDALTSHTLSHQPLDWIFSLPAFRRFGRSDRAMVLPPDSGESLHRGTRGTVLDDRLMLETASLGSGRSERLWNLRLLLAWADWWWLRRKGKKKIDDDDDEDKAWIDKEVVERLRAGIVLWRQRRQA